MKKFFKFFLIFLVVFFAALLVLPYLFRDQIYQLIIREANKNLTAELSLESLDLSLIRDFPNLSVQLNELKITGRDDFAGVELVNAGRLRLEIDLFSAFGGNNYKIERISGKDIYVHIITREDGSVNYLIVPDDDEAPEPEETEGETDFKLTLKGYEIENFNLTYDDFEGNMFAYIKNLNHTGKGDFSMDVVDLKTQTDIGSLTVVMDGIKMLNEVEGHATVNMTYEQALDKITLSDNEISINDLKVSGQGWLEMKEEGVGMDLNFSTVNSQFKSVLSLIPTFYMQDFEGLQASGTFDLTAKIFGEYLYESEHLPGIEIKTTAKNGTIKYPDLPSDIRNINFSLALEMPNQKPMDAMKLDIPNFHFNVVGSEVDGRLSLRNPETDPFVDMALKSNLDFEDLTKAVKLEGITLRGKMDADIAVKGRESAFEAADLTRAEASGKISLDNFYYKDDEMPVAVQIPELRSELKPNEITLSKGAFIIGQSDINFTGKLNNAYAWAMDEKVVLDGNFSLTSQYLNLNELTSFMAEEDTSAQAQTADTAAAELVAIPENIAFKMSANIAKIDYTDMQIENLRGNLVVEKGQLRFENVNMRTLGGDMGLSGSYGPVVANTAPVDFNFDIKNLGVAEAASSFEMIRAYAPILETAMGKLNANFSMNTNLLHDMSPDLANLKASGLLKTMGVKVEADALQSAASLLNNPSLASLKLQDADLRFKIESGRLDISPMKVKLGNYDATFSGSSGLDKTLDLKLATELPQNVIKVPAEIERLGITASKIPVDINIRGTFSSPKITTSFGDVGQNVRKQVEETIKQEIEKVKTEVTAKAKEEAEKLIKQAEEQGDKLIAQAKQQADKVKSEAKRQAENIRKEAEKQAKNLEDEAKGNIIKERTAKLAADKIRNEANEQAQKIENEANKQANNLVSSAEKEKQKLVEDARQKAQLEE